MPNTKSAEKRLRQNTARRLNNRSIKRALRTQCRKVREAVEAGNAELAETEFRLAVKKLDRAGARNIIHRNAAARTKSRLSARIKALKPPRTPVEAG
jgi:small subunit ribosomal protein S20